MSACAKPARRRGPMARKRMHIAPDWTRAGSDDLEVEQPQGIQGNGDINHVCAICDATLLAGVRFREVWHLVLRCPGCGTMNEIDTVGSLH